MRIAVDIGHPAHVHFFRNFIMNMRKEGHEIFISTTDKDIACRLLDNYGLEYYNFGRYAKSILGKLYNLADMDIRMWRQMVKFRPDIILGLASVRGPHAAFLTGAKSVNFDDTENGRAEVKLYLPFVDKICTPECYTRNLGKKQVRYPGYHELTYLHPAVFTPDPSVLARLGVAENETYTIMRFVSWGAVHDTGHAGLTLETKRRAVEAFSAFGKVFITSEGALPADLVGYRIKIPPEEIHSALAYASLLYGESATMASEGAVLGTPGIYLDDVGRGYTDEQEKKYGLVFNFTESPEDQAASIDKGRELLAMPDLKKVWAGKRRSLLDNTIDVTAWMTDLVKGMVA